MKTRQQYFNGEISFSDYYLQFATDEMRKKVIDKIGIERIKKAIKIDENLNNIPLKEWDMLSGHYWKHNQYNHWMVGTITASYECSQLIKKANESLSSATMCCIYKAIAGDLVK